MGISHDYLAHRQRLRTICPFRGSPSGDAGHPITANSSTANPSTCRHRTNNSEYIRRSLSPTYDSIHAPGPLGLDGIVLHWLEVSHIAASDGADAKSVLRNNAGIVTPSSTTSQGIYVVSGHFKSYREAPGRPPHPLIPVDTPLLAERHKHHHRRSAKPSHALPGDRNT